MSSNHRHGIDALYLFAKELIQRCGKEALTYYGKGKAGLKFDEALVTEAELHLNDFFQEKTRAQFPDHQVFTNNQIDSEYSHEGKRYLWTFDPIDGADNFQTGIPIWGMSLSLVENFWPIFGFFYMPATQDLFHAIAGRETYRGASEIHLSADGNVDDESVLLTYSRFHQQYQTQFPGKIRNLGCTAAHICYVATGRADAAIIANESFQDLAAARVIIESAGGKFYKLNGTDFFLNEVMDGQKINEPLLVTSPEKLQSVLSCIKISG